MKRLILASLVMAAMMPAMVVAQTTATVSGTVGDGTGALIPSVEVTAINTATGIRTTRISNETGNYSIPALQPGPFTIEAVLPGFQTVSIQVNLRAGQAFRRNFQLQVGGIETSVEVISDAQSRLSTTSASVGDALPEMEVSSLPLATRNVFDLLSTTAGAIGNNFAGSRVSSVNTTRDGLTVNDGRYLDWNGAFSATHASPDLVEEVQVSVGTVDAAASRGSSQVRLQTRSGTNQFHGAVFWTTNNSALNAQSWQDNLVGAEKDWTNRHQFGGRLGGPVIRNKLFFFGLIDDQRFSTRANVVGTVLTADARNGAFRYWPGVNAGNVLSATPSVDFGGSPIRPAGATGNLQTFNVFNAGDPYRTGPSKAPFIIETLKRMPLPNDFTVGDGLNTAGHRWVRRQSGIDNAAGSSENTNRNQYNLRLDYQINSPNKVNFVYTYEKDFTDGTLPTWPDGYRGSVQRVPSILSTAWTSTLSPTILNEFRVGRRITAQHQRAAYEEGCCYGSDDGWKNLTSGAQDIYDKYISKVNGYPTYPFFTLLTGNLWLAQYDARSQRSPLYQFADTLSLTRSSHSFQMGWEGSWTDSDGWNGGGVNPLVTLGAGNFAVQGIDASFFPGLTATDAGRARNLLTDLAGSVSSYTHSYLINDPKVGFVDNLVTKKQQLNFHQNDWAAYFKDNWNVTGNLTLNLGVRYDKYGVAYEDHGLVPVSKTGDLYGLYGPSGQLTQVELVGKHSPNPNSKLHNNDWNNFAPSLGFSYRLRGVGRTTVLRGGYGINYSGAATLLQYDFGIARNPGKIFTATARPTSYESLLDVKLPLPLTIEPFGVVPLTNRTVDFWGYEPNRKVPYIQNFNLSIERELSRNTNLSIAYVGTKGSHLYGASELNEPEMFGNGILDAFKTTRAGGNAALFDRMLGGINFGRTIGTVGVNGLSGSQALRQYGTTRGWIANGEAGQLAEWMNQTNALTGAYGGLLRKNGFPENFIVANPQFDNVLLYGNPDNSTYHSLQTHITRRFASGFSGQFTYTWSRAIGNGGTSAFSFAEDTTAATRDPQNKALQKGLQPFHRTHAFNGHGTWDLPFGPGRMMLSNAPNWLQRIVERWQLSTIVTWTSGQPLGVTSARQTLSAEQVINTPDLVGQFPKSVGQVVVGDGRVDYLMGFTRVPEPNGAFGSDPDNLSVYHANWQIVDGAGNVVLRNPAPGTTGNLGTRWFEGPSRLGLDAALSKSVRIGEGKVFTLRLDAINLLNSPQWANPNTDINSVSFGRITSATGARQFTANARIDF